MTKKKNSTSSGLMNNTSKNGNIVINSNTNFPFVSVCTPTFNRRPFINTMIKCFNNQDYPKDRMEWIIVDDGTDHIEDLVINHPNVKYYKFNEKMTLGKKRNLMHEYSKGEIIVYMDDDDYYPPERVSHAVKTLLKNKNALCSGSSEMYIYFKHIKKMYRFGPYGQNHATAGTFAFKRELLKESRYNDDACLAEEKEFLKNYTVPFVQLDPLKTILVFSHEHNTFDKRKLLDIPQDPNHKTITETRYTVSDFIKEKDIKNFYMNEIHELLNDYDPGKPEMKPDVIAQTKILEDKINKTKQEMNTSSIVVNEEGKPPRTLKNDEIVEMMENYKIKINELRDLCVKLNEDNTKLKSFLQQQQEIIDEQNVKINNLENKLLIHDETVIISS